MTNDGYDKIQLWQNAAMTKYSYDKIQLWQNTAMTKYGYDKWCLPLCRAFNLDFSPPHQPLRPPWKIARQSERLWLGKIGRGRRRGSVWEWIDTGVVAVWSVQGWLDTAISLFFFATSAILPRLSDVLYSWCGGQFIPCFYSMHPKFVGVPTPFARNWTYKRTKVRTCVVHKVLHLIKFAV